MKGKEGIINFLVIVALLGYIISSVLLFKEAFELKGQKNPETSPVLMYLASALTGLVGGIVAAAFGVKTDNDGVDAMNTGGSSATAGKIKMQRVGEFAMGANEEKLKEKLGTLYAWAYILVGIASIVVWAMLNADASQSITTNATTFIGMMLAIVSAFFKD
ncbi:conserved membrane hypothetical protein [Tenacibaculum sp. 190524A05c]|uniref:hypothetical protein n=1 Tax=Tenacibaculum platacis TaxID=3137852 RepID=UPI0031FB398C